MLSDFQAVPLTSVEPIKWEDEKDAAQLAEMAGDARRYITAFPWCRPIAAMNLADGIGGIFALFLVEFESAVGATGNRLWVVVGDLPSAYMAVAPDDCAQDALERYCLLMDDWIEAVRGNRAFDKAYPASAPRTEAYAENLADRLGVLRDAIIPEAPTDIV